MFLWKKKFGDIHISGYNETLCGRPMLGNNYANQEKDSVTCEDCINKDKKLNNSLKEKEIK